MLSEARQLCYHFLTKNNNIKNFSFPFPDPASAAAQTRFVRDAVRVNISPALFFDNIPLQQDFFACWSMPLLPHWFLQT